MHKYILQYVIFVFTQQDMNNVFLNPVDELPKGKTVSSRHYLMLQEVLL